MGEKARDLYFKIFRLVTGHAHKDVTATFDEESGAWGIVAQIGDDKIKITFEYSFDVD
jgi:hypothetical protein